MSEQPSEPSGSTRGGVIDWLAGRLRSARAWERIRSRLPERLPLPRRLLLARLAVVCTIIVFGVACVAVVWQLGPLRREVQRKASEETILLDLRARIAGAAFLRDDSTLDAERGRLFDHVDRLGAARGDDLLEHETVTAAIEAVKRRRAEALAEADPNTLVAEVDRLILSLRDEEAAAVDLLDAQFDLLTLLVVGALVLSTVTLLLMERTNRAKEKLAALHYRATHDHLTQGLNRGAILNVAERELARALRSDRLLAVVLIDLDQFKEVNDGHGHAAGDAVIREAAKRLRRNVRIYDSVGRYGGDEFLVVLPDADEAEVTQIVERLRLAFGPPMDLGTHMKRVSISLGGAVHHGGDESLDSLIARADRALYRAKAKGRDGWDIDRAPPIPKAPEIAAPTDEDSVIGRRENSQDEAG